MTCHTFGPVAVLITLSLLVAPAAPAHVPAGCEPDPLPACSVVRFTFHGIATLWVPPGGDDEVVWVFLPEAEGHRAEMRYRNWDQVEGPQQRVSLERHHVEVENQAMGKPQLHRAPRNGAVGPPCHPRSPHCRDELASSLAWLANLSELRAKKGEGDPDFDWSTLTRKTNTGSLGLAARFKFTNGTVFVSDFWKEPVTFEPSANGSGGGEPPGSRMLARSFSVDVPFEGDRPLIARRALGADLDDLVPVRLKEVGRCVYEVEVVNQPEDNAALTGGEHSAGSHFLLHYSAVVDHTNSAPPTWFPLGLSSQPATNAQCSPAQAP